MGNSAGIFSDQDPLVLSSQMITARTTVKTDLATIINENDVNRATNTFINSLSVSTSSAKASISPAVTQVANQTVGAGISAGEISQAGQPLPCFLGNTLFSLWDRMDIPFSELYENQTAHRHALSFDADGDQVKGEIIEVFKRTVYEYIEVTFADRESPTEVVPEHRYYIQSGIYVPIKYLLGKCVVTIEDVDVQVLNLKHIDVPGGVDVYNAHIRTYENYCADGKRVHNIKNFDPELENPL